MGRNAPITQRPTPLSYSAKQACYNTAMMKRERQPHTHLSAVRHTAILLAFLALVAQMVVSDLHATAMPVDASSTQMGMTALPCGGMCGPAVVHVCLPASRICAAVAATLTDAPLLIPLLLALAAFLAAPIVLQRPSDRAALWLWPPERRRALLQVFLI